MPVRLYPTTAHDTYERYPMSVHVRYEPPKTSATDLTNLASLQRRPHQARKNEVTKVALRKTAAFVVLAEDVNPEAVSYIPLICDDNSIPFGYVPSQEFLAKEAGMETGVKAASLAIMDAQGRPGNAR